MNELCVIVVVGGILQWGFCVDYSLFYSKNVDYIFTKAHVLIRLRLYLL